VGRTQDLFEAHRKLIFERTDRFFGTLLSNGSWVSFLRLWFRPDWAGQFSQTHIHVWAAIFLGGATQVFHVLLCPARQGSDPSNDRCGQMLMGALLIHLTEAALRTFSLFSALWRFWLFTVIGGFLISASAIVAVVIFCVVYFGRSRSLEFCSEPWRAIEHAGWVIFEDIFLI